MPQGILLGADITQEWILPWWWRHYSQYNHLPVAFVDFGLSFPMKKWCLERGELIPLRVCDFAAEKPDMDEGLVRQFEADFGSHFWNARNVWFKKPLACLQSPFETTLWLDVDCEVRGSLSSLFTLPGLAMAVDAIAPPRPYLTYNSGVMLFRRPHLFVEWAAAAHEKSALFRGDQELLSSLIAETHYPITLLDPLYNWSRMLGECDAAQILHWHGENGKKVIRQELSSWAGLEI